MNYFITGGTGSVGKELVRQLSELITVGRIVIFSRNESRQAEMAAEFPEGGEAGVRYFIGDICDYDRLLFAMKGSGIVIHAAAMKHIDKCEYNPTESIKNNVFGTMNVARACSELKVSEALFISTDKACSPISAYGAQKYASERFWIGMNNMSSTRFNLVRYGNVRKSTGSFYHKWKTLVAEGKPLPVTSDKMSRFFWNIESAAFFIINCLVDEKSLSDRGCIYVPKMKSEKLIDIAKSISDNIEITGLRCPEKLQEELICSFEGNNCYDCGDHYILYPDLHEWVGTIVKRGVKCVEGFSLSS